MKPFVKWVLIGVPAIVVMTAIAIHYWNLYGPDLLEERVEEIARGNSIDCGRVKIGEAPGSATACALAAHQAGKPFHVRYDIRGIDSQVAIAIVRDATGNVSALAYDSDIQGGGGRGHQVVNSSACPKPFHLWVNPSGRINCFQQQTSPRASVMSPNLEPY